MDIVWKESKLTLANLRNISGEKCRIRYGDKTVDIMLPRGESCSLDCELKEILQH